MSARGKYVSIHVLTPDIMSFNMKTGDEQYTVAINELLSLRECGSSGEDVSVNAVIILRN